MYTIGHVAGKSHSTRTTSDSGRDTVYHMDKVTAQTHLVVVLQRCVLQRSGLDNKKTTYADRLAEPDILGISALSYVYSKQPIFALT